MKILVISDTHGKTTNVKTAINIENPDKIYHLGDAQGDELGISYMSDAPLDVVCGNCDYMGQLPQCLVLEVGRHVLFLAHGHMYGVDYSLENIRSAARSRGADMILHGHTHRPGIDYSNPNEIVACPGSISYPRQESKEHTYLVIDVDRDGELCLNLHSIEEYERKQKQNR